MRFFTMLLPGCKKIKTRLDVLLRGLDPLEKTPRIGPDIVLSACARRGEFKLEPSYTDGSEEFWVNLRLAYDQKEFIDILFVEHDESGKWEVTVSDDNGRIIEQTEYSLGLLNFCGSFGFCPPYFHDETNPLDDLMWSLIEGLVKAYSAIPD
jgi:hypothetical protein